MIGYICSAITDFVVTFADDSDIVNLHGWSQGSFFRNELEQCAGGGSGSRDRICMHVPVVETGQCLPAW